MLSITNKEFVHCPKQLGIVLSVLVSDIGVNDIPGTHTQLLYVEGDNGGLILRCRSIKTKYWFIEENNK